MLKECVTLLMAVGASGQQKTRVNLVGTMARYAGLSVAARSLRMMAQVVVEHPGMTLPGELMWRKQHDIGIAVNQAVLGTEMHHHWSPGLVRFEHAPLVEVLLTPTRLIFVGAAEEMVWGICVLTSNLGWMRVVVQCMPLRLEGALIAASVSFLPFWRIPWMIVECVVIRVVLTMGH